jgi:voltage-gated potassium channel
MSPVSLLVTGPRRSRILDVLRVLAGVVAGVWLPFVLSGSPLGRDRGLAIAVDALLFVVAGLSALDSWHDKRPLRRWLLLGRDLAIALPLPTLIAADHLPDWSWVPNILALLYVFRLSALLARFDALPPSAARLLLLLVVVPLTVWWGATGWLLLGGDPATTDPQLRLVRALYWTVTTLTTVGYGDIVPQTMAQMLYACAIMVTGVAFFGFVLSNIASLTLRLDAAKQHQEELRDRAEFFMRYHRVPPVLRQRVRAYFKYLWASRHGYSDDQVLDSLPRALRADLAVHLHRDLLAKVPVLKDAGPEVLRDLVVALRPAVYLPGDLICTWGSQGDEMYFIVHGAVEVLDQHGKALARLHDGDFFGEVALLTNSPRNATARAEAFCDLYVLDRATFERVAAQHPLFHASIDEKARARQSATSLPALP